MEKHNETSNKRSNQMGEAVSEENRRPEGSVVEKELEGGEGRDRGRKHRLPPIMTSFEFTKIIAERVRLLNKNAPPLVEIGDETDVYKIAEMEMKAKKIPIVVRRQLPDGTHEDWRACDLRLAGQFVL